MDNLTPNHHPVNKNGLLFWMSYMNTGSVSALGTWKDYSGNGNNGTLVNDAFIDNNGFNGDGTSDWVNFENVVNPTVHMTLNEWIYIDVTTGTAGLYGTVSKENGNNGYGITLLGSNYGGQTNEAEAFIGVSGGARYADANVSLNINQWYMLTMTYDGSSLNIYIDGVLKNTTSVTGSIVSGTADLGIGKTPTIGRYFNGKVANVQIYDRAWSAGEVKRNYLKNKRG